MKVWQDWLLTAARAAVHVPTRTAVVADLHLGYAEARRAAGEAVPRRSVAACLEPLRRLIAEQSVSHLVLAGDVFEKKPSTELSTELEGWLEEVGVPRVTRLAGNHDKGLVLDGTAVMVGDWEVVHGDGELPTGRVVQGHLHPALRMRPELPLVPCYLTSATHLVLPAFALEAAGVLVSRLKGVADYEVHAIVGAAVLTVGA